MSQSKGSDDPQPLNLPDGKAYTHRAHRFPGKFHPPLVEKLIKDHPGRQQIADPMCGSGTVGVQAVANGRQALCMDLDPLACLMTRGKTNPVDPNDLRNVSKRILGLVEGFPDAGEFDEDSAMAEVQSNLDGTPSVVPINLFHWFDPYVAVGFSRLLRASYSVLAIESTEMTDAIRTSLASMIRHISRADPQPVSGLEVTSVRKEQLENGLKFDVEGSFGSAVKRLAEGYQELQAVPNLGETLTRFGNAKEFSEIARREGFEPSLVITSPPYCNAIEYTRRHRLEYEWLGLFEGSEQERLKASRLEKSREFFGSHTIKQSTLDELPPVPHPEVRDVTSIIENEEGQERKANLLRKYFLDSYDWIEQIHSALTDEGRFCLTIGSSTSYGHRIDTPEYVKDIALEQGFEIVNEHQYKLTNNKMQYPTNGATTDYEHLIIFEK